MTQQSENLTAATAAVATLFSNVWYGVQQYLVRRTAVNTINTMTTNLKELIAAEVLAYFEENRAEPESLLLLIANSDWRGFHF